MPRFRLAFVLTALGAGGAGGGVLINFYNHWESKNVLGSRLAP